MILPIYRTLAADDALKAVINPAKQIHEEEAPIDTPVPYIVWQAISGQANNHLDEPANFDDVQFQLMVYDSNLKRAYEVKELARKALEQRCWVGNPALSVRDSEAKLYGRGFDANWILER